MLDVIAYYNFEDIELYLIRKARCDKGLFVTQAACILLVCYPCQGAVVKLHDASFLIYLGEF